MAPPAAIAAACLLGVATRAGAQITVMAPTWLKNHFTSGRVEGSTTTIGAPFYGDRVLGRLVYADSDGGCPAQGGVGTECYCSGDDYEVPDSPKEAGYDGFDQVRLINIVLVRRGLCSFATKVKVAYDKGAHAVIIVDKPESNLTRASMKNVIVAEEASGDDIHIPSVFVCKDDGQTLIDAAKSTHDPVVIELAWNVPQNKVVTVDQWMSSASRESLKFLREFSPKRKMLNQVLIYQPHFAVFGMGAQHDVSTVTKLCSDDTGKYCAEDPDGDGPITGRDVLEEDLRQLCIHEQTKVRTVEDMNFEIEKSAPPEFAAPYWNYIEQFSDACPIDGEAPKAFGKDCSVELMKKLGMNVENIIQCASLSNTAKLEHEVRNAAWSPRALRINGWRYSGILDAELVATAICSGFLKEPRECAFVKSVERNPFHPFIRVVDRGGISFGQLIAWLLVVVALVAMAFFLYKQYLRKEMRATIREEVMLEVEAQMGEYGKLKG